MNNRSAVSSVALLLLGLTLQVVGCGGSGSPQANHAVRDSAGIRVVDLPAVEDTDLPVWSLNPRPEFKILQESPEMGGGAPPEFELWGIRGVAATGELGLVVANGGTQEIHFFDGSGRFLRSAGGAGEGPGEFLGLAEIDLGPADSVFAWDQRLGRISVFSPAGDFHRSFQVPNGSSPLFQFVGVLTDGSSVVAQRSYPSSAEGSGLLRGNAVFLRLDREGELLDTLANELGVEVYLGTIAGNAGTVTTPFSLQNHQAIGEDRLFVGTQDRFEIREYGNLGEPISILRSGRRSAPLAPEKTSDFITEELGRLESQGMPPSLIDAFRELYQVYPFPEHLPSHGPMLVDSEGNLWIQGFSQPDEPEVLWAGFNQQGVPIANLPMDSSLILQGIESGFAILRSADDHGIESVEMRRIQRGGR